MSDIRARYTTRIVRQQLLKDWKELPDLQDVDEQPAEPVNELPKLGSELHLPELVMGPTPDSPKKLTVGIIGAGCAGLFTAMCLDFLNEKVKGLDIGYEILEAGSKERLGGRLYTHKFPGTKEYPAGDHDYYDVGAMRFPDIPIMKRTFDLFKKIGITDKLREYYLYDDLNKCPTYFNDIHHVGSTNKIPDPFKLNDFRRKEDMIPSALMNTSPDEVIGGALEDFKSELKSDIESGGNKGWEKLMAADLLSTRQYLSQPTQFGGKGYNFNTVSWLETFEYATGWYDQSLSETVLESMDFDYPLGKATDKKEIKPIDPTPRVDWKCIEGGTQQVAEFMAKTISTQPKFDMEVRSIATLPDKNIRVVVNNKVDGALETRDYFAVFNSTTLAALQRMDLTKANLTYGTKQAIRSLGYGASCKVGIRFSYPWWIEDYGIAKGGIGRTDLPLRVCVYPSYNVDDPRDKPAVLLCSYTWSQDAQRIASLISRQSPQGEEELKELMIRNLALLHCPSHDKYEETYAKIEKSYLDHYSYDWYKDPYMSGAFAYFAPGQFSVMFNEIVTPNGWLFLIGEATSSHHAWIVGALESAVRGVYQFLQALVKQGDPEQTKVWQEAMGWLKRDDKESWPFGPLPADAKEELLEQQVVLGFFQQRAEEQAAEKMA